MLSRCAETIQTRHAFVLFRNNKKPCVTDKAKVWEFPKTRDGQTMTLAFAFNLS